jgi:hypothetical protein
MNPILESTLTQIHRLESSAKSEGAPALLISSGEGKMSGKERAAFCKGVAFGLGIIREHIETLLKVAGGQ